MIGIYKITSPSGRVYIGQSRDLDRRKIDYQKYIKNSNRQVKLLASINKYTWDKHFFEIIEICNFDDLNIRERYWQEHYNCVEKGLNCVYTKTNDKPAIFGLESKAKMSKAKLGKKVSEKTKLKMSLSKKGKKIQNMFDFFSGEYRPECFRENRSHLHSCGFRNEVSRKRSGPNELSQLTF